MPSGTENQDVKDTLAKWTEEYLQARANLSVEGITPREKLSSMSGMDFFAAMMRGDVPPMPMANSLGFGIVSFDFGRVVMQGVPDAKFRNFLGVIHGGWIASVLDSAMGCTVHTTVPEGVSWTTVDINVSYLRPLVPEIGFVRVDGRIISSGRKIAFAEASLYGPDGKEYARSTTTCAVFPA